MDNIGLMIVEWLPLTIKGFSAYNYDDNGMAFYTIVLNA